MERKIYNSLVEWKTSKFRKPLLLQGARQVGKTYIVNYFGTKEYVNIIYCNFEQDPKLKDFFNNSEPVNILKKLSIYKKKEILPNQSLIIFDEVQACPQAIISLKYFKKKANEYHIIATGSLLGLSVNRNESSFPVGKVDIITMYPMSFDEFILAVDKKGNELLEMVENCYNNNISLEEPIHEMLLEYYKQYLFIGGMPEVVKLFIETKNNNLVRVK